MLSIDKLTAELKQDKTFLEAVNGWNSHNVNWKVRGTSLLHMCCNMFSVRIKLYQLTQDDKGREKQTSKRSLYYCQCCHKLSQGYIAEIIEKRRSKKYQ
ncbi:MAG: hypothetical protein AABW51_05180 [Nanoarchaeota archaeon]